MSGLLGVSVRALRASLRGNEALAASDVAELEDSQLRTLVKAAVILLKAAELELVGRDAATPAGEATGER